MVILLLLKDEAFWLISTKLLNIETKVIRNTGGTQFPFDILIRSANSLYVKSFVISTTQFLIRHTRIARFRNVSSNEHAEVAQGIHPKTLNLDKVFVTLGNSVCIYCETLFSCFKNNIACVAKQKVNFTKFKCVRFASQQVEHTK